MATLELLHGFLWGLTADWITLVGVFLSLGLQLLPLRALPWACGQLLASLRDPPPGPGEISSLGALMTALGGTLGIGHLTGMAISLGVGGPGVLPWMWLIGLVSLATRYCETFLAVRFRRRNERGEVVGGPMEAIRAGLGFHWRGLATLYAALATVGVFTLGNGVQAQELAAGLGQLSGLPPLVAGMAAAALLWVALAGGLPRISRICTVLVPVMSGGYLLAAGLLLGRHAPLLPGLLAQMGREAFGPQALAGGALAITVRAAVRTTVFTSEAGLGVASIAHAPASPADPVRQGALAMLAGVMSLLVCSASGLLLLMSGVLETNRPRGDFLAGGGGGLEPLRRAFVWAGGDGGAWIPLLCLVAFAFTTLLAFGYYGERCCIDLVGPRGQRPFRLLWIGVLVLASSQGLPGLWGLGNTMDALMALPNLLALLLLSGAVFRATRARAEREAAGAVAEGTP
jgi:AGCS family alanine or glycine:cation symporter